jgi:hypothetical protein
LKQTFQTFLKESEESMVTKTDFNADRLPRQIPRGIEMAKVSIAPDFKSGT